MTAPDTTTATEAAALRRLYLDELLTLEDIGKRFGVSGDTIRNRCLEYGIPLRPRGRLPLVEREPGE